MTERKPKDTHNPKTPKKITQRYLHNAGLHYLQRFTASSGHFRFIMMRKIHKSCKHHTDQSLEACEKMLDAVIADFEELGYLNDAAYCKGMVASLRRRGASRKAITMKLKQKRLTAEDIEAALTLIDSEIPDEDPDLRAAILYAKKKRLGPFARGNKIAAMTEEEKTKAKNRALGSLARAGYSFHIAQTVLDMSPDEAANIMNARHW